MAKYSKLWEYSKETLQHIFDTSSSLKEVLHKCGLNATTGGTYRTVKIVSEKMEIDLTKFESNKLRLLRDNAKNRKFNISRDYSKDFTENSTASRGHLKKFILKNNILVYQCKKCQNNGWHNDEPLTLQLEHINGIGDDNRIENLCFLCPNCHSQTATYAGKKNKHKKLDRKDTKKFNPTKEELAKIIWEMPTTKVAEHYGVTDVAIGKRCKQLGINKPPRGYWTKKKE